MYLYVTCMLIIRYSYVIRMYSYVSVCYSYVTHMSFVCTRMYPYVTRMYSYVIRMYSYVPVCYSYVTRMLLVCHSYVLVCIRMLLVELVSCLVTIGATHLRDCLRKEVGRSPNQCSRNDFGESFFILNHLCSFKTNCFSL